MCNSWFDDIAQYIISIYNSMDNRFNTILDEHMNEYLQYV